jgi:hypothetical protein
VPIGGVGKQNTRSAFLVHTSRCEFGEFGSMRAGMAVTRTFESGSCFGFHMSKRRRRAPPSSGLSVAARGLQA